MYSSFSSDVKFIRGLILLRLFGAFHSSNLSLALANNNQAEPLRSASSIIYRLSFRLAVNFRINSHLAPPTDKIYDNLSLAKVYHGYNFC
ncbi:hypothetical protein K438DRAFT_1797035 [Mycena galopus ATCC 62051]|nr:hypothetical protein K438DRAFT_1797035 [Mycena galopus ATCC 62051]